MQRSRVNVPGLLLLIAVTTLLPTLTACGRQRSQAVSVSGGSNQKASAATDQPSAAKGTEDSAEDPAQPGSDRDNNEPGSKNAQDHETRDNDSATEVAQLAKPKRVRIPSPSTEILKRAIGCTVRLRGIDFDGSGIVVGRLHEDAYILTVEHGTREKILTVEFFSILSMKDPVFTATENTIVSKDKRTDLAILKVAVPKDLEIELCLPPNKADFNNQPDYAYSSGCSEGRIPTVLRERITGSRRIKVAGTSKNARMWVTESPQSGGRSGGPLINDKGSLLGVALGKSGKSGYYCHLEEISQYLIDRLPRSLVTWGESGIK